MKPPIEKRRRRESISTGIGRYKSSRPRSIGSVAAIEFLSGYCVYPELGQDISVEINKALDRHKKMLAANYGAFASSIFGYIPQSLDRAYGVQMELVESHRLLRLTVSHFNRRQGDEDAKWSYGNSIGFINLRITEDGLIADFYEDEEVPKYNPGNCVTIINQDERELQ